MEKPAGGKREVVVTQAEFDALLGATRMREFRDLLIVSWETGCRPQESLRVEARHVDLQHARWVFPASEAKSKNRPRIIYLTEPALEITQRLMLAHPAGPLFHGNRI
jgi:integrase